MSVLVSIEVYLRLKEPVTSLEPVSLKNTDY